MLGEWSGDLFNTTAEFELTEKICAGDERTFKFDREVRNSYVQQTYRPPAKPNNYRRDFLKGSDKGEVEIIHLFKYLAHRIYDID